MGKVKYGYSCPRDKFILLKSFILRAALPYIVIPLGLVGIPLYIYKQGAAGQLRKIGNCHNFGNTNSLVDGCTMFANCWVYIWVKPSYCLAPLYIVVPWGLIWDNWESLRQTGIKIFLAHHSLLLLQG